MTVTRPEAPIIGWAVSRPAIPVAIGWAVSRIPQPVDIGAVVMTKTIVEGIIVFSATDAWAFDNDTAATHGGTAGEGTAETALAPVVGVSGIRLANPVI